MILKTDRLILRYANAQDAKFILDLINSPEFIQNIGDRKVHNLADSEQYILNRMVAGYSKWGFGSYIVESQETQIPMGLCGLVQREGLEFPDIGFAFLRPYWHKGYALESSLAVLQYAKEKLNLHRVLGITKLDNQPSIRLLEKLGLKFEKIVELPGVSEPNRLFSIDL